MTWIQTYTGRAIHFDREPRADEIDPVDLAMSLSRLARFNGHSRQFYSVAQHCCIVAANVEDDALRLPALLHDAHEAYLGDIVTPLKRRLDYAMLFGDTIETHNTLGHIAAGFDAAIAERFGFDPSLFHHKAIVEADARALATEKRDLVTPSLYAWKPGAEPYEVPIIALGPDQAGHLFDIFLMRYACL